MMNDHQIAPVLHGIEAAWGEGMMKFSILKSRRRELWSMALNQLRNLRHELDAACGSGSNPYVMRNVERAPSVDMTDAKSCATTAFRALDNILPLIEGKRATKAAYKAAAAIHDAGVALTEPPKREAWRR